MSIQYPIVLPAQGFRSIRMSANDIVTVAASPFTGQQQVQAQQGQFWRAEVAYPPMKQDGYADDVTAALVSLRGQYGTFLLGDSSRKTPRGLATLGSGAHPRVSGASQTGLSLLTAGWSGSTAGILKAGDYIELGGSNLLKRSNDFSHADWAKSTVTVTANNVTGPEGTSSADTGTAGGSNSYLVQPFSSINPGYYTAAVWLKVPSGTKNTFLIIDSTTKAITITTSWQRFTVTHFIENFNQAFNFFIGGLNSWTTGDIHFAQAQASAGDIPDAYQETSSAVVTTKKRLHKVTFSANSDSSGVAIFNIWPRLRESPAEGSGVKFLNACGTFRLASNERSWDVDEAKVYGVSFSAVEAI